MNLTEAMRRDGVEVAGAPAADAQGSIAVLFDGSPASHEKLRRATRICEETGSTLDVALSTDVGCWSLAFGLAGGWDCVGLEDEMLEELQRALAVVIADAPRRIVVRSRVVSSRDARRLSLARAS
jgi:hypothetical protein